MKAYLARMNATHDNPHELVGIFVASSMKQLTQIVDECVDVEQVEVLEVGAGGLFWPYPVEMTLPYRGNVEEAPDFPAGATFTERWISAEFDQQSAWQQLDADLV